MTQDSSSTDRRLYCRVCNRPRLRAVALLTNRWDRLAYWGKPLCEDDHEPPHADSNPLLETVDLTCEQCGGIVNVEAHHYSQSAACEDCHAPYYVTHDGTRYRLRLEVEDPDETQGDLRYHERN